VASGNGPLPTIANGPSRAGVAERVDDHGRIVGELHQGIFVWPDRESRPRRMFGARKDLTSLHDSGYLTGAEKASRGYGGQAWLARLSDGRPAILPGPPMEDPTWNLLNALGRDLARGTTTYAPQGGVTVAGAVLILASLPDRDVGLTRAVLWTCAQTYGR